MNSAFMRERKQLNEIFLRLINGFNSQSEEIDGYLYRPMQSPDVPSVLACLEGVCANAGPLAKSVEVSPAQMRTYIEEYLIRDSLDSGLSVVAIDQSTGEIAGCILVTDFGTEKGGDPTRLSANFLPIVVLLEDLDRIFRQVMGYIPPGQVAHVVIEGVSQQYMNSGIARNLFGKAFGIAKSKGFSGGLAEATGPAMQHLGEKWGATNGAEIKYQDFEFENTKPFAGITVVPSCIMYYGDF